MKAILLFLPGLFFLISVAMVSHPSKESLQPLSQPTAPADTISKACTGEHFRAFDYWLGTWIVRNAKGDIVGHSTISRVSDGCAILEEWSSVQGGTGKSLSFYDPGAKQWRQMWVGGDGMILDLSGNLEDGNMTLYAKTKTPKGMLKHRIRWTLMDDGRVKQRWDTSTDHGATWEQGFLGYYETGK